MCIYIITLKKFSFLEHWGEKSVKSANIFFLHNLTSCWQHLLAQEDTGYVYLFVHSEWLLSKNLIA